MGKYFTYVPGAEFPYQYRYEHMAVTTDCVIFTYEYRQLKVLLVRRGAEPYKGSWAFPGGFLQMKETAREGALRELREETGLEPAAIGELGVFSDVDRDPRERVITIAYYALVKPSEVIGGDDADEAAWFPCRWTAAGSTAGPTWTLSRPATAAPSTARRRTPAATTAA